MQAPKIPAMFSLFKQRQLKGFDYAPRYYDPKAEERRERIRRSRASGDSITASDREDLRDRLRHSWQREGSNKASSSRLLVLLGVFAALTFALVRMLGLTDYL